MKGKFWIFFTITVVLCAIVFGMYWEYIRVGEFGVFIESYEHGSLSVDTDEASGSDSKYRVMVKKGDSITININPERTDKAYYVLDRLEVNGVDVTDQVSMLQYKTVVENKLSVVATFKKGKKPEDSTEQTNPVKADAPVIENLAENPYIGSYGAYNVKDPCVIYDEESKLYYCFGSDNVVIKSKDLVSWYGRTTYFDHPENAESNAVMTFSKFKSVAKWAKQHGYDSDEAISDKNNDRTPLSPEIVKIGDTYYLYFALSKVNGSTESAIFCVKTNNLAEAIASKKWDDVGLVISTCSDGTGFDAANAVHPSVINTGKNLYMAYGGYYGTENVGGEIYLVELSTKNGLLKTASSVTSSGVKISTVHGGGDFTTGTLIADPGAVPALSKTDGSLIGGADLVHNSKTGYYYLFMTYGYEGTNYNIRVARSKDIAGPYTDSMGNSVAEFSDNMYDKGTLLLAGYNFSNSFEGRVSYTDVGRGSIGAPNLIKTTDGDWFLASQSQIYYKVESVITTGGALANEKGIKVNYAPCLEIRELSWNEEGWPMAMPELYAGKKAGTSVSLKELYGNWDVITFKTAGDKKDYKAVERNASQMVTILSDAVISQNDIKKKNDINTTGTFVKSGKGYTVTIDGVEYKVYVGSMWDWELEQGSIFFYGAGSDGSMVWGKKNRGTKLGLYTDAFYYLYDKCDETSAATIDARIEKMKDNPTQQLIDKYTKWMVERILTAEAE